MFVSYINTHVKYMLYSNYGFTALKHNRDINPKKPDSLNKFSNVIISIKNCQEISCSRFYRFISLNAPVRMYNSTGVI